MGVFTPQKLANAQISPAPFPIHQLATVFNDLKSRMDTSLKFCLCSLESISIPGMALTTNLILHTLQLGIMLMKGFPFSLSLQLPRRGYHPI